MPLIRTPALQYQDTDGTPIRFAKAYFTETETTTPAPVYQDEECTNPHTNPVVADAQGLFPPIHFDPALGLIRCRIIPPAGDLAHPMIDADPVNDVELAFADVILTCTGNPSAATQWLGGVVFDRAIRFPSDFSGSRGKIPKTLPAATFIVTMKVNGAAVGTATCDHVTGEWTYAGAALDDIDVADQDELDFYGPLVPGTITDFGLTIKGRLI